MPEFPDINAVLCRKKLTPKHTPFSVFHGEAAVEVRDRSKAAYAGIDPYNYCIDRN